MNPVKKFLRSHREVFGGFQVRLTKAGMKTMYDSYLTRAATYSSLPLLLAVVASGALWYLGRSTAAVVAVAVGLVLTGAVAAGFLLYPSYRAATRESDIDAVFPHVLILTYALSRSGMSFFDVADVVADSEDVYGEISEEFARLRRDVEYYGEDLLTALDRARDTTPSDDLESFFDDLAGVLESQTGFTEFAENRYRSQFEEADERQQAFLQRLKSFAQAYVVLLFVGPLFGLVLLIMLSFAGANTLPPIYFVAYVYPVVGILLAIAGLEALESSVGLVDALPDSDEDTVEPPEDDPVYSEYRRSKLLHRLRNWSPRDALFRQPLLSLLVTVPAAAAVLLTASYATETGFLELYGEDPVTATAVAAGLGVLLATPLALLYGFETRSRRRFISRVPDTVESLREGVAVGMSPVDACQMVWNRTDGEVAEDIGWVYRQVDITGDSTEPFEDVGRRRGLPEFTLAMKTLKEAMEATNDVQDTLHALAESTRSRVELRNERRRSMELYTVVIVLGLAVFVVTAVFLELFFLPRLQEVSGATEQGFLQPAPVPPKTYSTVLYQATLIQATVNGLFIGKLRNGSVRSGLGYTLGFVVLASVPFLML